MPAERGKPRKVIGGYAVVRKLGRGADGVVYLAESTDGLGKRVALKVFRAAAQAAFARELEAYGELERLRAESGTPHLVEGLAAGTRKRGGGYIALAYQPGGTLADLLRARGALPAAEALRLTDQLLAGLGVLHAAGLRHGDVKPTNALLGQDGVVRLGDFGLSGDQDSHGPGGTPGFAAPELYGEGEVTGSPLAADVYAAAATLYALLVGRPPLPGAPDLLALEARDVPRRLHEPLLDALDPDPAARPDVDALRARLAEAGQPSPEPATAERRVWPVAVVAALLGVVAVAWATGGPDAATDPSAAASGTPAAVAEPTASPAAESTDAPATEPPAATEPTDAPAVEAPPALQVTREGDASVVRLGGPDGPTRVLYRSAVSPVYAVTLDPSRIVLAVPPVGDRGARLLTLDPAGEQRGELALPRPAVLLGAHAPWVAVATSDGAVHLHDAREDPPRLREVARFAHAVTALRWEDDAWLVEGDQRAPTLLAAGEAPPPGHRVLEGARGRYAFAREPALETVRIAPAR